MEEDEYKDLFVDIEPSLPLASPGVFITEMDINEWGPHIEWTLSDSTYDVKPTERNPEVYTSHEQREQHDKYPALQKAWEDYIAMYNLTKGEPPYVD